MTRACAAFIASTLRSAHALPLRPPSAMLTSLQCDTTALLCIGNVRMFGTMLLESGCWQSPAAFQQLLWE
jgi:hypothetical protein